MIDAPLALAFGAGMVATVNPCGFAMLPAYLSFFLGLEGGDSDVDAGRALPRALAVGATMTAGFVLVFGLMGALITNFSLQIQEHLPWATVVIGISLVGLGIALLLGRQLTLRVPKMQKGGGSRELGSMFLFGVSYAVASLSCTIGPFLAVTSTTFRNGNFLSGVLVFVTYGLGMGALITLLTLGLALAKTSILSSLRKAMPYVNRISGALMVIAGAYVAYYGWYEIRLSRGDFSEDPIIDRAISIQNTLQNWVLDLNPNRIGIIAAVVGVIVFAFVGWRRSRRAAADTTTGMATEAS